MQTIDQIPQWALPSAILNPEFATDAPWAVALKRGDEEQALACFVSGLRQRPFLPDPQYAYIPLAERWNEIDIGHHGGHDYHPDDVVRQRYVGAYGIEHTFDGEIDWLFDPTRDWGSEQTWEWQVQFNRHYHWVPLARAWEQTGREEYVKAFERELLSWVCSQCPAPLRKDMRLPGTWRTIEVGIRSGWTWPLVLEIFRRPGGASDLALWLMVAALREHGRYLLLSPTAGNFKTMENNGLAHVGMLLPSLLDAEVYASTAIDRAVAEMERQFYPDGCQDELSHSYGRLSMSCTFCIFKLAQNCGLEVGRGTGIPSWLWDRLGNASSVYARLATPDGWIPGFHDCSGMPAGPQYEDVAALPSVCGRGTIAPWQEEGGELIPWGGYGVIRKEGRWALLDGGPWGTGHQHSDALQVMTWGKGGFWCVDPGKPLYNQSRESRLIRSSEGHNVVLMDGQRHLPEPVVHRASRPLPMAVGCGQNVSLAAAARVTRGIDVQDPLFCHQRLLMDISGAGWLVVDRLVPFSPEAHTWEWLWHFPVGTQIIIVDGRACIHRADGAVLNVIAVAGDAVEISKIEGCEAPFRGWAVDPEQHKVHALPVLVTRLRPVTGAVFGATLLTEGTPVSLLIDASEAGMCVSFFIGPDSFAVQIEGHEDWQSVTLTRNGLAERLRLAPHAFPQE